MEPHVDTRGGDTERGDIPERVSSLERDVTSMKTDLAVIRANYATKTDIAQLETKIAQLETTMLKWFIATAITLSSLAFAAAKFIH